VTCSSISNLAQPNTAERQLDATYDPMQALTKQATQELLVSDSLYKPLTGLLCNEIVSILVCVHMRLLELPRRDAPRKEDIKFLEGPILIVRDMINDVVLNHWGAVPVAGFR
jgi:hypothetical protein